MYTTTQVTPRDTVGLSEQNLFNSNFSGAAHTVHVTLLLRQGLDYTLVVGALTFFTPPLELPYPSRHTFDV